MKNYLAFNTQPDLRITKGTKVNKMKLLSIQHSTRLEDHKKHKVNKMKLLNIQYSTRLEDHKKHKVTK